MPEPKKTKGGGKADGNTPKKLTPEEMAELADERPLSGLIPAMIEQDRLNGLPEDHQPYVKPNEVDDSGDSSQYGQQIFDAVAKGATGKLDKLLSRSVGSPDCRDSQGRTPLIVAAEAGNTAMVGVLIRYAADVNAVDADSETALMKAAYSGHLDVAELLVSKMAALDIRNNEGLSAVEIAQEMEHEPVVAFLSGQSLGLTTNIGTETSTDPGDNSTAVFPPGASKMPSAVTQACEEEPGSDTISEVAKSSEFEPQKQPEQRGECREETAAGPTSDSESHPAAAAETNGAQPKPRDPHDTVLEKKTETRPAPQRRVLQENEERIEFDALDNKQVRSINEKIKKVLDKAGFELGDHVVDTVFKGSYMAVLKPRSQENKRWRKLKKHPDWLADPRRLTELSGACAVRRFCLGEGIEVSQFSVSHFIELFYVKNLKLMLMLAEEASANKYSVRQLKKAADDLREHKDDHDPGKEIIRTLDQPVPFLDDPDLADLCTDKERVLEELSKAERKKIRILIKERKPALDEWKNLMDAFEVILSDLEE